MSDYRASIWRSEMANATDKRIADRVAYLTALGKIAKWQEVEELSYLTREQFDRQYAKEHSK